MTAPRTDIQIIGECFPKWRDAICASEYCTTLIQMFNGIVFNANGPLASFAEADIERMQAFDMQGWISNVGSPYVTGLLAQGSKYVITLDVRMGDDAIVRYTCTDDPAMPIHAEDLRVVFTQVHVHKDLPQSLINSLLECIQEESTHEAYARAFYCTFANIDDVLDEDVEVHPIAGDDALLKQYADSDVSKRIAALLPGEVLLWIHITDEERHEFITVALAQD